VKGRLTSLLAIGVLVLVGAVLRFAPPGTLHSEFLGAVKRLRLGSEGGRVQRRGYYERLAGANRVDDLQWANGPKDYKACFSDDRKRGNERLGPMLVLTTDWRGYRLKPDFSGTCFGVPWKHNRYGFRDKDWTQAPKAGTTRVAVMGTSFTTGWGAPVEKTYPVVLEELLNANGRGERYEVMNVSVPAYSAVDQIAVADEMLAFSPHVVLYVAAADEVMLRQRILGEAVEFYYGPTSIALLPEPIGRLYPKALEELKAARSITDPAEHAPAMIRMIEESYRVITDKIRSRGAIPIWTELPDTVFMKMTVPKANEVRARAAGFATLDLADVFAGYDNLDLWAHEWDDHPNELAHRLIAKKLAQLAVGSNGWLVPNAGGSGPVTP
jgi:hypothetical protein